MTKTFLSCTGFKLIVDNMLIRDRELIPGCYQPAEKWLNDSRDRTLTMEEIQHYQKIILALMETERVMGEVNDFFTVSNKNEDLS